MALSGKELVQVVGALTSGGASVPAATSELVSTQAIADLASGGGSAAGPAGTVQIVGSTSGSFAAGSLSDDGAGTITAQDGLDLQIQASSGNAITFSNNGSATISAGASGNWAFSTSSDSMTLNDAGGLTVGAPTGDPPSPGDVDISGDFKKNGVAISGGSAAGPAGTVQMSDGAGAFVVSSFLDQQTVVGTITAILVDDADGFGTKGLALSGAELLVNVVKPTGSNPLGGAFTAFGYGSGSSPGFYLYAADGTPDTPTKSDTGQLLGGYYLYGWDGSTWQIAGLFSATAQSDFSGTPTSSLDLVNASNLGLHVAADGTFSTDGDVTVGNSLRITEGWVNPGNTAIVKMADDAGAGTSGILLVGDMGNDGLIMSSYGAGSATAGAITLDKQHCRVTSEALTAATTYALTLTNSYINANSLLQVTAFNSDGLATWVSDIVPGSGSAVITVGMAALTGTVKLNISVFRAQALA